MFDRYMPCGLDGFFPVQAADTPLPPPRRVNRDSGAAPPTIQDILSRFHLNEIQSGDLLLLGLFVFLLNAKADDELLIALGLLLIL